MPVDLGKLFSVGLKNKIFAGWSQKILSVHLKKMSVEKNVCRLIIENFVGWSKTKIFVGWLEKILSVNLQNCAGWDNFVGWSEKTLSVDLKQICRLFLENFVGCSENFAGWSEKTLSVGLRRKYLPVDLKKKIVGSSEKIAGWENFVGWPNKKKIVGWSEKILSVDVVSRNKNNHLVPSFGVFFLYWRLRRNQSNPQNFRRRLRRKQPSPQNFGRLRRRNPTG